jgi:hypothetical protein
MVFALKGMFDVGIPKDSHVIAMYDSVGGVVPFKIPEREALNSVGRVNGGSNLRVPLDFDFKHVQDKFLKERDEFIARKDSIEVDKLRAALFQSEVIVSTVVAQSVIDTFAFAP